MQQMEVWQENIIIPSFSASLPVFSTTCSKPKCENIRWKIPEMSSSHVLNSLLYWAEWWTLLAHTGLPNIWVTLWPSVSSHCVLPSQWSTYPPTGCYPHSDQQCGVGQRSVYAEFRATCSFRHPPEVLACMLCGRPWGGDVFCLIRGASFFILNRWI